MYKSGDLGNCTNYRGLGVTSCLGKLGMLSHFQARFRKGYRTTDTIFIMKTYNEQILVSRKEPVILMLCGFFKSL